MENILPVLGVLLAFALLYVIGGIGDNVKKIRKLLEKELQDRHGT